MIEILSVIGRLSFRFAKTMPEHPHEYVRRTADNASLYDPLFKAIGQSPIKGVYGAYTYRYLYPGDGWKYWITASFLINRARVSDDDPHAPGRPPGQHA